MVLLFLADNEGVEHDTLARCIVKRRRGNRVGPEGDTAQIDVVIRLPTTGEDDLAAVNGRSMMSRRRDSQAADFVGEAYARDHGRLQHCHPA